MEFVKNFTRVRFPKISILPEKRVDSDIFGKKWISMMFYSSILNKLSVVLQISTQIQSHSSYFGKNVIFRINS